MTKQQHTPTPYAMRDDNPDLIVLGETEPSGWVNIQRINPDGTPSTIASAYGEPYEINKANAEFIVTACNAHDELVAALETAVAEMVTLAPRLTPAYRRNIDAAIAKCRAALKARPIFDLPTE